MTIHLGIPQKTKKSISLSSNNQIRNNAAENSETCIKHFHSFSSTVLNPSSNFAFPVQKSKLQ